MLGDAGCKLLELREAGIFQYVDDVKLRIGMRFPGEMSITSHRPDTFDLLPALTYLEAALSETKFLEASEEKRVTHCLYQSPVLP